MAKGKHTLTHWKAAQRVLQYLKKTRNWSLRLGGREPLELVAYCDASWADNQTSRKSTLGYCFNLGKGMISWKSKLSSCVALSTAEAEYYAATEGAKEGQWLTGLLEELGVKVAPYIMKCDSQSAICMIKNPVVNARSKHIELKYHFIRQLVEDKALKVEYVRTDENWADCFTKALPVVKLLPLCKNFMTTEVELEVLVKKD
jgi:hypothetical protein